MKPDPNKRILLIDGDLATHAEFRRILCIPGPEEGGDPADIPAILQGLELDAVGRGSEGLALAREALQQKRPYLLAVVDLERTTAPDGMETVHHLLSHDPALGLLIRTLGDRGEIARQLGKEHRLCFLSKPTDPDEVRQSVAAQIDGGLVRRRLQQTTDELESARRELQRVREEVRAAGRAKSEFMANVSHEIRTPMNAILGFTRLLMKEPLGNGQLQKLSYVHDAGTSLLSLINNILDYSKLSAGQLKLSETAFHLDALLGEVWEETRASAREKRLAVRHHVVEAVPRWLRGDQHRFRQVLVSLVGNAIKFTECGTIHVHITLDEQTEQTATLRVVVSDTGVGIPVERQAIIFESFSQADGSATRQFEGVGLGLSICKQLVDLMGGQVGFRSLPSEGSPDNAAANGRGPGSSFWLTLTFSKHQPSEAELAAYEQTAARWAGVASAHTPRRRSAGISSCPTGDSTSVRHAKPHVLVAENDYVNRTLAEMLLTRAGCLVDLAESGREALAMLQRTTYDLLLIDAEMLETEGSRAVEQIRRQEEAAGRRLPIVPTTCGPPGQREPCLAVDAEEWVPKPFTPEMLIGTVRRHLPGCLDDSEPRRPSDEAFTAGGGSDPPRTAEDYLRCLHRALEREDFRAMERHAGALKRLLSQAGPAVSGESKCPTQWAAAADQAMRVQLAARSNDLKRVASALPRLEFALPDGQAPAAAVNTPSSPCASRGGPSRENPDC